MRLATPPQLFPGQRWPATGLSPAGLSPESATTKPTPLSFLLNSPTMGSARASVNEINASVTRTCSPLSLNARKIQFPLSTRRGIAQCCQCDPVSPSEARRYCLLWLLVSDPQDQVAPAKSNTVAKSPWSDRERPEVSGPWHSYPKRSGSSPPARTPRPSRSDAR